MNKSDLIAAISQKSGLTRQVSEKVLASFVNTISETLANGEDVQVMGFGGFAVTERPARTGRNPRTGDEIKIPAAKTPKFKPGKALKDALNS